MSGEVKSKGGAPIEEGDTVNTPYRGGKHEGEVSAMRNVQENIVDMPVRSSRSSPILKKQRI